MQNEGAEKYGNRARHPGRALVVRRYPAAVVVHDLDSELRTAYADLRGSNGTIASRAIYDAGEGYQHPHRFLVRRLVEAWQKGVPKEKVRRPLLLLLQFIDWLYADSEPVAPSDDSSTAAA